MANAAQSDKGRQLIALAELKPRDAKALVAKALEKATKSNKPGKAIALAAVELGVSPATVFRLKAKLGIETKGDRRPTRSGGSRKKTAVA